MTKLKNKKRLSTIALAFMLVFLVGAAFAATIGDLDLRGTADVWISSPPVDVAIIDASVEFTLDNPTNTLAIPVPLAPGDPPPAAPNSPLPGLQPGSLTAVTTASQAGFSKEKTFTVNFTCWQQEITVDYILENIGEEDALISSGTISAGIPAWLIVTETVDPAGVATRDDDPGQVHNTTQRVGQFTIALDASETPEGFYELVAIGDPTATPATLPTPLTATFTISFDYGVAP